MPTYQYIDHKTGYTKEVFHPMSECDNPTPETIKAITYKKRRMVRVPQGVMLNGAGKTEQQMIKEKGALVKKRNKAHTANEGYKDIKFPEIRNHIEQKRKRGFYNDVKGVDHEKIKV